MLYRTHQSFPLPDKSYYGTAKREIERILENQKFSANEIGKANIIIAEMLSNLGKFATQGQEILVKVLCDDVAYGIEILCLDNAPGMQNPQRMLEDGVSTSGTAGEGLGAIKRLSDVFDIYSAPGNGTIVLSHLYKKTHKIEGRKTIEACDVMVPIRSESSCGDGWSIRNTNDKSIIFVMDGLGHGPEAEHATLEAIKVFQTSNEELPNEILRDIHSEIKKTRGGVAGVVTIDIKNESLLFCGIGNICGKIISKDEHKSLISYNGTLGHNIPRTFNNNQYDWNDYKLLVLQSDGLKNKWDPSKYLDWQKYNPSVIAASLYKDNSRKTDDSLVVTIRTRNDERRNIKN